MGVPTPVNSPIISVIVPAFNEEASLANIVRKVLEVVPYPLEIVVIDDCSTDRTQDIAESLARDDRRVRVFRHAENAGKTAALITGLRHVAGDVVIIQDADLEYDPADIASVVRPIVEGRADVVYGSRFLQRDSARMAYFYQRTVNRLLTILSNLTTGLRISDVETGYKAFRSNVIQQIEIVSRGFAFEIEVTAKLAKLGYRFHEVPISYRGRTYGEGKKIVLKDCLEALWSIVRFSAASAKAVPAYRRTCCDGRSPFPD